MAQTVTPENSSVIKADADFHWLKEALYVAQNTADTEIVVDIAAVRMVSSDKLNELIRLHLELKHQGRRLVLENVQHQLWEIVTLTRLNRLIDFRGQLTQR